MARKWTNRNMPGALHFVTGNVLNRRPIIKLEKNCVTFLEEMQGLRLKRICRVIAFVLMPDHIHLIINPRDGDIQTATGMLKGLSAKRIIKLAPPDMFANGGENQVWQESFKALPLWSGWMIDQKVNYIHANPIRANLCATTADYKWSSFRGFYPGEDDPLLAVDKEWWWEGDEAKLVEARKEWEG